MIYADSHLSTPVAAPAVTLPWITGNPHSLYARVRAITTNGATPWSSAFGFDMVPPPAPAALTSYPGLLRWSTIDGAYGYQVWIIETRKIENVTSNVLDERELYTLHQSAQWTANVHWRVRALRLTNTSTGAVLNGVPAIQYGAWSPVYSAPNPTPTDSPLKLVATVSTITSDGTTGSEAHTLMPAFTWTGDQGTFGEKGELFRVYVFTDSQCLNRVFTSAVVGSPAYAPRPFGPLKLPATVKALGDARNAFLPDGSEPASLTFDGETVSPTESQPDATPTLTVPGAPGETTAAAPATTPASTPSTGSTSGLTFSGRTGAPTDLWDVNWPESGYYWTVVPVTAEVQADGSTIIYRDMELPEDACWAGRVMRFGKESQPALTSSGNLFATGLSSTGRLTSALHTTAFYGEPLISWTPSLSADAYEVQWSKSRYPFVAETASTGGNGLMTSATSVVMPVGPGVWWYRVRGFDFSLPTGSQQMSWSIPARLVVAKPSFKILPAPKKKKH